MSTGPSAETRNEVLARDHWSCVSCGRSVYGRAYSIHHRIGRGMGGSSDPAINLPSNLLTVCGSGTTLCHGWIESHPQRAREWGYKVLRQLNPAHQPVLTPVGWRFFNVDGSTVEPKARTKADRAAELVQADEALAQRLGRAA